MHELSIARNLVDVASQHISHLGPGRVACIRLKVGVLSCVHRDSLLFSFDLVTADTPLAGTRLEIEALPILIYCAACDQMRELPGIQSFRCPECNTPSGDIRQGRELDVESIEWVGMDSSDAETPIPEEASS